MEKDVIIVGAGLTGLSAGVELTKKGLSVAILEKNDRVGGQIETFRENGFLFESGPNTGSGASQEVIDLYKTLSGRCEIEFAAKEAESRWIWKGGQFHPLPGGLVSGITTPLFTFADKLRILGEPFRTRGTHPDETIAAMTTRRLGKSFLDYAVDPFLSGIYAGDPHTLITRYALPKLYNLEQHYGSFIGGSIKKAREAKGQPQTEAKKGVFSTKGGMENLPKAMAAFIGEENLFLSVHHSTVHPDSETGLWKINGVQNGVPLEIRSKHLITTVGAYLLPELLSFVAAPEMDKITNLRYAPVVQVAVGVKERAPLQFKAFGGLISSREKEDFLGVLFPSSCFSGRSPEEGMLFSFFMGGVKKEALTQLSDREIEEKTVHAFHRLLKFPKWKEPDMIRIFRHKHAIPQYELSSGERFDTVSALERKYAGLHIAGNLRDGIGMAHRIIQGINLGREIGCES
ncbi:MAG: protoporphyrinogen oxidase [Proteiniphilum sp.]|nr:protoporphyrinogen oxidase [Proteiniphilum sp.]